MKISVEGYKSISTKQELEFDGLTILSGANSSGKSSFMQPFLILKQTLENHYDSGYLILNGENAKLTDSSQIISKVTPVEKLFTLSLSQSSGTSSISYKYKRGTGLIPYIATMKNDKFPEGIDIRAGMRHSEIVKLIPLKEFPIFDKIAQDKKIKPKWRTIRDKCFLSFELSFPDKEYSFFKAGIDPTRNLERFATTLIHVPGLRGYPERRYKVALSKDVYPGSFEKYVASIILDWSTSKKEQKNLALLINQLQELELANNIKAEKIDDTSVEVMISRAKNSNLTDCVSVADVGFGVTQTLPVLVALLVAKKGQAVYIEQPELHLHPKAQFILSGMIVEAVERGVKVIIETHSSILIRGFQISVLKKKIAPNKISLNWFSQNSETGATTVDSCKLDEFGAFGDWPEDFEDTTLYVESMYLDAVEEAISGQ
ncbi:AAA family ATPase [Citrobacter europaeus]|uniref:AAA family ATPase n=1 Tax=Citrobacter europaeus TaxID=1914243 RepID=UPI001C81E568|nr:AAA family ATPase [Citrobacter europaeus]GIZ17348.1 hypothetical protein TUM12147_06840 [Citrobacter europaeus]GIZ21914.1 hypothetical protein TUM12148_05780 [Citrobacter europaeus]